MRPLCLFGVLVVAKVLILAGRDLPISVWTLPAYLWQDAALAFLFLLIDWPLRGHRAGWVTYGILVAYVAINVPIARTFSTPLTWPMLRSAHGTLADSIAHHVTAVNLLRIAAVLSAAGVLPLAVRRIGRRGRVAAICAGIALTAAGPLAEARVDTQGMGRNPITALALPRRAADPGGAAPDARFFDDTAGENLAALRGGARGRNVVMVILESAGARYLRPYGAIEDPMPTLSTLADRSILFERAYAVFPESIKGLYSVICSTHPAMDVPAERYVGAGPPSIARVLLDAEYRTGLFHSGRFAYLGMESVVRDRGFETLEDAETIGGDRESSFGVDDLTTVRRVLSWIDAGPRERPFFAAFLPIAGHHPYEVPGDGPFSDVDDIDRYRNALHYSDRALAMLVEGLRSRGLEQDTLFVIFGDHGEAFGQHEGNFGHTLHLYEENVRVPFLIVAPGLIDRQIRVGRLASLVDTAPTILDLLGVRTPPDYQGRTLLHGPARPARCLTDYSMGLLGLRDGKWKAIHELDSGRMRLFDLEGDPGETRNLAADCPERAAAYRADLVRWCEAQRCGIGNR